MSDTVPTNEEMLKELRRIRLTVRAAIASSGGTLATIAVEDSFKFFCRYANLIEDTVLKVGVIDVEAY